MILRIKIKLDSYRFGDTEQERGLAALRKAKETQ